MPRYRVLPYRQGSRSARELAQALGGLVLRLEGSRFRPRHDDIIINWGNTSADRDVTFNRPGLIRRASNKREFFALMRDDNHADLVPQFWTDHQEIPDDAFPIVCRTVLAGHSGDGIVIAQNRGELVPAPLYVRYVKKQEEYRVHCAQINGERRTIAIQRKARRADYENPNWQIRNHANGFIYVRNDVNPPPQCVDFAHQALQSSGLDFGAVDVIYNQRQDRAYVLEINTAPGLEGQTIEDYARFFTRG